MKPLIRFFLLFVTLLFVTSPASPVNPGDFRTKASGNWNQLSVWQYYNGSSWVNATYTPSYADGVIDVLSGYAVVVTANVTIDQTDNHGTLTISSGVTLTLNDGSSTDLSIYNPVTVNGTFINKGTISGTAAELIFNNGSLYQHNKDGGALPDATWNDGSTCEITGVTGSTSISNVDQSFYHFKWNCTVQTAETNCAGNLEIIRGNFTMASTGASGKLKLGESADYTLNITGNWDHQGGTLNMGGGSSYGYINLSGNFAMSGGKVTEMNSTGYYATITFVKQGIQTFSKTGGSFENNIDFAIGSGTTLDVGTSVVDGSIGQFSVNSGSTLKTAHDGGIAGSGASGCIRTTNRYYSMAANYHFYKNGMQQTGNGMPSPLNGKLLIGTTSSATGLTLTNGSITINGTLILFSSVLGNSSIPTGTVSYGSNGTLEYQGASAQNSTIKEWPTLSPPFNVTLNNSSGLTMDNDRTIGGNLSLTAGTFTIGAHTLTLNGTMVKTSGSLTGGPSSHIIIGGSSMTPLDLPDVNLATLQLNRPGGTRLTGNVTLSSIMTMTSGQVTLSPLKILSYSPGATLKYNGTAPQTTFAEEFPQTNGPSNLMIEKPGGISLNLALSRTLEGTLLLNGGNFQLGINTLTLNGSITPAGGFLIGGLSSSIIFGGAGITTNLPSVELNNLTINRASGIGASGNITVSGALSLAQGMFRIGTTTLTINGSINKTGGGLEGGSNSTLIFGPGASGTTLPGVVLYDLVVNRTPGISMTGNVTVGNLLTLISGPLSIGANILTLNGLITTTSGSLTGGSTSEMIIGGSGPSLGLPGITLKNLQINRTTGVMIASGSVTIESNLELDGGIFSFDSHSLTLNGSIVYAGGGLAGGFSAILVIGGSGSELALQPFTASMLTLNRIAGLSLLGDVTIYENFFLTRGAVNRNGYTLYSPSATLIYNASTHQVATDGELPATGGPKNIRIMNNAGVELHANRSIPGTLTLQVGTFSIGPHALTINGNIQTIMGTFQGGPVSDLILGENAVPLSLPSVTLNNLTVNRSGGTTMTGPVSISGTLDLENGNFNVGSKVLSLSGQPVTGNGMNLMTTLSSGLNLSGNSPGVQIPEGVSELGTLFIGNTGVTGVAMTNSINISGNVNVTGLLNMLDHSLTGVGSFNALIGAKLVCGHPEGIQGNVQLSGPQFVDAGVDYEFNGSNDQLTSFLPTSPANRIRNLVISNTDPHNVTLNSDITVTGTLDILPGARFTIEPGKVMTVETDVVVQ